jgi:hypothetical protein
MVFVMERIVSLDGDTATKKKENLCTLDQGFPIYYASTKTQKKNVYFLSPGGSK